MAKADGKIAIVTADAPATVAQFYQQQLGQSADANSMMVSGSKGGKTYAISITPSEGGSAVTAALIAAFFAPKR